MKKNSLSPHVQLARAGYSSLMRSAFSSILILCLAAAAPALGQNVWTGIAGDTNWSTAGNWSFNAIPTSSDTVAFDNVVAGTTSALVDNIVDTDFTITGLTYGTASTNGFHTTSIPSGRILDINGAGGNAIFVGTGIALNNESVYSRFVGGGKMNITNTTGAITVVQGGANNDHRATLDLSGLTNFSAEVDQVLVGALDSGGGVLRPMGGMLLAETNVIRTAAGTTKPGIIIAAYPGSDTNVRGTQQLFLGQHNVINADVISMGGHKSAGQILMRTGLTGGYVSIRGSAGGTDRVKLLTIADPRARINDLTGGNTGTASTGLFDTTGSTLDLTVVDLMIARSQTTGAGTGTGTLTIDEGTIDADNLFIGYHTAGTTSAANAVGTLNVNGTATVIVNNDLVLARKVGTGNPTATVNIGGTVNVFGNVVTSNGISTINLTGGTLDLQPAGDGTPGSVTVGTLTGNGTITNAANVTNFTTLTVGEVTAAGTLNVEGNYVLSNTASINFNVNSTATIGGGVNDLLNVTGDIILSSNVVNGIPLATTLATGSYRLINYTGSRTGFLSFTNPTRYNLSLDYATANQINLINAGGTPANLTWRGTNGNWNLTTSNWNNGAERFLQLDAVTFDNTGLTTNITIAQQSFPSSVTVNSSTNYYFAGAGRISGATGLTKSGTGTLRLGNANDFVGPVTVSAGTLQAGNASALGTTNGGTTVANGATLDLAGTSLFNPGEHVTISGAGVGGNGAIINSGADQNNGIRFITLAGNSSVGAGSPGRWDIRGPVGSGSFSGGLFLNGFTLTKLGVGKISLVDSIITNSGSLVLSNGTMGLTRSIIDGPGTITGFGTNTFHIENSSTGYITKPFIYNLGGGTMLVTGNGHTLFSPITNNGGLTIDNAVALTLTNIFSGAGPLTKMSAGNLTFLAPYLGGGPTTISGGRLTIGTNSSISATPRIALGAGATFDVSALSGGLTLASGQVLSGSGAVIGDVSAGANTGIVPGTSAGTLSFSNNLALNNSSNVFELNTDPTQIGNNVNDLVQITNNLTLSGVNNIKIVPIATLNNASPYTLFQYGGSLTGAGANLSLSSDSRYAFTVVDPLTTPGSIQINVAGSGTSANLVWEGGSPSNPTAWDTKVTTNWSNLGSPDAFFLGDNVEFDDLSATNRATLIGTVQPAAIVMNNNALNYTFDGAGSLVAGSLTLSGASGLTISNTANNSIAAPATVNAGSLTFANIGQNTFGAGLFQNAGSVLVANAAPNEYGQGIVLNGGTMTFDHPLNVNLASTISNAVPLTAGTLVKQGSTMLTLSGNNTNFDGPILVNGGTLRAANGNALGNNNGNTTVASGATLDINATDLNGTAIAPGDIIIISGTGLNSTGAVINTGAEQQNALRAITLAANASVGSWNNRWDLRGPGGSGSLSGALNLSGFTLTKLGGGRVSLVDVTMTDAGSVEVTGGTLAFTRSSVDGAGYINMGPNLLLLENNSTGLPFTKALIFSNGTCQVIGNALTVTSPITNLASTTMDLAVNLTVQGPITGPGSINKISAGTLILAETNDYTGGTLISAGGVQLGINGTLGNLPPQPGGVLTNNGTLIFNRGDNLTFSDHITGTGGVQQMGGGTVFLNISNSYAGQTFINSTVGGVLQISHSDALGLTNGNTRINGDNAASSRLELVGGLTLTEPFQLDGRQGGSLDIPHIQSVSGSNTLNGPIVFNTGGTHYNFQSDSGFLTVNAPFIPPSTANTRRLKLMGDGNGVWNGVISNSLDTLVPGLLAKVGAGTWTLAAANVYSGETTIVAGTLALAATGSINNTTNIDVQSGATFNVAAVPGGFVLGAGQTLMGSGTVVGNVTASGTVSPGASVGTLTFANNLVLAGTTVMEVDRLATPNADLITASLLTYGGTLVVTNIGFDPLQNGDTFNLFDWTARNGSFGSIQLPALDPGLSWDTSQLTVNGTIKVVPGASGPTISGVALSGTDLIVSGTNGPANGQYVVISSTDIGLPRSSWTPVVTNTFDGSGNFAFTNAVSPITPRRFFTIQLP
jgi:fibronectin-binding autotransporter adhesin